jgi:hypothetical protein
MDQVAGNDFRSSSMDRKDEKVRLSFLDAPPITAVLSSSP